MEVLRATTESAIISLRNSTYWVINLGVIAVCYLSGPFGTLEVLPSGIRLIYWALIVLTTSSLALWMHKLMGTMNWRSVFRASVVSLVYGLIVAGVVMMVSLMLLTPIQSYPGHVELLSYSFPSAVVIFFLSFLVVRSRSMVSHDTPPERAALFSRLEKHSDAQRILSLSAQDHYVEVTTELGTELCLIRLSDAIAEAEPEEGYQVHRSHWVAKAAVKKLLNKGTNSQVILSDERILSVSQSRLSGFKEFLNSSQ